MDDNAGFEIRKLNGEYKLVRRGHPSTSENSSLVAACTSYGATKAAWSLLADRPFPEPIPE
jgi:hypothetical protein